jgi:hypothetical protein
MRTVAGQARETWQRVERQVHLGRRPAKFVAAHIVHEIAGEFPVVDES